jgi:hypothetical protein
MWVDGNDAKWRAKKNAALRAAGMDEINPDVSSNLRYFDNDELKYSLRGAEKFAPWINHIFIITDNQVPKWLDAGNKKITIVDHAEIMPDIARPCFNSTVIEMFIQNIPGLSEYFLLANDDMFFGNKISPDYFFTKRGMPRIRGKSASQFSAANLRADAAEPRMYSAIVRNAKKLILEIFGENHDYAWKASHCVDPYLKSEIVKCLAHPKVQPETERTFPHHFREYDDIQRTLFHEFMLARRTAKIKIYHGLNMAFNINSRPRYITHARTLNRMLVKPKLFCINSGGENAAVDKYNHDWLQKFLPNKSVFEV